MNDPHSPAARVYYWFWFTRMIFAACAWIMALIFGAIIIALVVQALKKAPSVGGGVFIVLGGIVVLALVGWGIKAMKAGKLTLLDDRVLLPRLQLPPWCFFAPHAVEYRQVRRYGMGTVRLKHGVAPVIMFEFIDNELGERTRRRRLSLVWYREQQEIEEELTRRIGRAPEVLESTALGDVRFKAEA